MAGNNGQAAAPERQHAARITYRASLADNEPLSGAELGRRFDRSPRWGLDRIAEVHAAANPHADAADRTPVVSPHGTRAL